MLVRSLGMSPAKEEVIRVVLEDGYGDWVGGKSLEVTSGQGAQGGR